MNQVREAVKAQAVEPLQEISTSDANQFWNSRLGSNNGKFVADVSFKIDGLKYDPVTGMFSMQMELIEMTDEQWHVIAGQFGLASIPDYLRDDLCRMVHKHRIIEQMQMNLSVE